MKKTELYYYIQNYTPLIEDDWNVISEKFELIPVKKNDLILETGKVCHYLYFLQTGLLRYFYLKDGEEITKFFTQPPFCFTSQSSFTSQTPASESIQALEDCTIFRISLENSNLLNSLPVWNIFIRELILEVNILTEKLFLQAQNNTAEERYIDMFQDDPQLLQKVPLKYLASYLGIAPQSLSRIRKKITKPKS